MLYQQGWYFNPYPLHCGIYISVYLIYRALKRTSRRSSKKTKTQPRSEVWEDKFSVRSETQYPLRFEVGWTHNWGKEGTKLLWHTRARNYFIFSIYIGLQRYRLCNSSRHWNFWSLQVSCNCTVVQGPIRMIPYLQSFSSLLNQVFSATPLDRTWESYTLSIKWKNLEQTQWVNQQDTVNSSICEADAFNFSQGGAKFCILGGKMPCTNMRRSNSPAKWSSVHAMLFTK